MTTLASKTCIPCQGGVPPLEIEKQIELLRELNDWKIINKHHLSKNFSFHNFRDGLDFVNEVGQIAEQQGHHPDIFLSWGKVRIDIWTHKIDNLVEADFILAAKIDQLNS